MGNYDELVAQAIKSLESVHPKQPKNLRYGSAVLTKDNKIYFGANYWSYTASLVLHAEQVALTHAAIHGERNIVAIACVSTEDNSQEEKCHPCGMCKQLIWESSRDSGIDIDVVMANRKGEYIVKKISEIVLFPWPV